MAFRWDSCALSNTQLPNRSRLQEPDYEVLTQRGKRKDKIGQKTWCYDRLGQISNRIHAAESTVIQLFTTTPPAEHTRFVIHFSNR